MIKSKLLILSISILFLLSGCLTVEKKIYKIELKTPTSGRATIIYKNIQSQKDDNRDVSLKDFAELVTDYLEGNKIESEFEGGSNMEKKLYVKDGLLMAEFSFDFDSLSTVKLFKYDQDSPYMILVKENFNNNEEYDESNGDWGGEKIPILFWKKNTKSFTFSTKSSQDMSNTVDMVDQYENWKKSKKNK